MRKSGSNDRKMLLFLLSVDCNLFYCIVGRNWFIPEKNAVIVAQLFDTYPCTINPVRKVSTTLYYYPVKYMYI